MSRDIDLITRARLLQWAADPSTSKEFLNEARFLLERQRAASGLEVDPGTPQLQPKARRGSLFDRLNKQLKKMEGDADRLASELRRNEVSDYSNGHNLPEGHRPVIAVQRTSLLSCFVMRSEPFMYEVRACVRSTDYGWNHLLTGQIFLGDFGLVAQVADQTDRNQCLSFHVTSRDLFGHLLFDSLGLAYGQFYESPKSQISRPVKLILTPTQIIGRLVFGT